MAYRAHMETLNWQTALAASIRALGEPDFPRHLIAALGHLVRIDCSLVLVFRGDAQPLLLFDDTAHAWRANTVSEYLRAAYLLDPFWIAACNGIDSGVYRLADLAPDGFTEGEYYSAYYARGHVEDEICLLERIDDETTIVLSLERREGGGTFSKPDLAESELVVRALLAAHWRVTRRNVRDFPSAVTASVRRAYLEFGTSLLSPRECEVVRLLLEGHSTRSLAVRLGISPGTAKVHRERIYSKLGISQHAELFRLFIGAVCALDEGARGDPLANYRERPQNPAKFLTN